MAAKRSAGILAYRGTPRGIEVFLVHPGGPFWRNKDDGSWSVPKGEPGESEEPLTAAVREFEEETGLTIDGTFVALPPVRQAGGKIVTAWAVRADFDAAAIRSNTFTIEWPPRSGRMQAFPEIDRAGWFTLDEAERKMLAGQRPLLAALAIMEQAQVGEADTPAR